MPRSTGLSTRDERMALSLKNPLHVDANRLGQQQDDADKNDKLQNCVHLGRMPSLKAFGPKQRVDQIDQHANCNE